MNYRSFSFSLCSDHKRKGNKKSVVSERDLERHKDAETPGKIPARRNVGQRVMDKQELERVLKGFLEDKRKPWVKQQLMTVPVQSSNLCLTILFFLDPIDTLNLFTSYAVKLINAHRFLQKTPFLLIENHD